MASQAAGQGASLAAILVRPRLPTSSNLRKHSFSIRKRVDPNTRAQREPIPVLALSGRPFSAAAASLIRTTRRGKMVALMVDNSSPGQFLL